MAVQPGLRRKHVLSLPRFRMRRLSLEGLEDRTLLASGALLQTIENPAPTMGDRFGWSVAVSGDLAVVGADGDQIGDTAWSGAAYVYDLAAGRLLHTLASPSPKYVDFFGHAVAVSGYTVVVGAPYDDSAGHDAGAAYVFDAATGGLRATLTKPGFPSSDYFGTCLAVSGNTVVVAAPQEEGGPSRGAVYVFDATSGALLHSLRNPSSTLGDTFGDAVGISGGTIVVSGGAAVTNSGIAYVFDSSSGELLRTLHAESPDYFGHSVSISGNTVALGAARTPNGGSVYVFDTSTGNLLRKLANPTPQEDDHFGHEVVISGSKLLVSDPYDSASASDVGIVYVFDAATGELLGRLHNPTPNGWEFYAWSIAASESTVIVGSPGDLLTAGVAYVFDADKPTGTSSIGGMVWSDRNGNGRSDVGETRIAGRTVYLDGNGNGKLDTEETREVTDHNGVYTFTDLAPGTYVVREVLPGGWRQTRPSGMSYTVAVADGQAVNNRSFGNQQLATISGKLWNDKNGNKKVDAREAPLAAWTVFLDTNGNGKLDARERRQVTDSKGAYSFTNLAPGRYRVRVVRKNGWRLTTPVKGSYTVQVVSGQAVTNRSFGNRRVAGGVASALVRPAGECLSAKAVDLALDCGEFPAT